MVRIKTKNKRHVKRFPKSIKGRRKTKNKRHVKRFPKSIKGRRKNSISRKKRKNKHRNTRRRRGGKDLKKDDEVVLINFDKEPLKKLNGVKGEIVDIPTLNQAEALLNEQMSKLRSPSANPVVVAQAIAAMPIIEDPYVVKITDITANPSLTRMINKKKMFDGKNLELAPKPAPNVVSDDEDELLPEPLDNYQSPVHGVKRQHVIGVV